MGLVPGSIFAGRYEIIGLLGKGGMGSVYRAVHRGLRRDVALKILEAPLAINGLTDDGAARFEREARAIARLDHAGIVRILDYGRTRQHQFIAMQLLEGPTLGKLLRETSRLAPSRALQITRHLLSALAHAHACGVLHRDLKPDNVMLVGGPQAFGSRPPAPPVQQTILGFAATRLVTPTRTPAKHQESELSRGWTLDEPDAGESGEWHRLREAGESNEWRQLREAAASESNEWRRLRENAGEGRTGETDEPTARGQRRETAEHAPAENRDGRKGGMRFATGSGPHAIGSDAHPAARAVLIDFGLAHLHDEAALTARGACVGSPSYLAPERLDGAPPDVRADLYAVGVLLYEMLAGQRPYTGESIGEILLACRTQPARPLRAIRPELSRPLEAFVVKALAKDPTRRFQTAEQMLEALENITALERLEVAAAVDDTEAEETFLELPLTTPSRWSRMWGWLRFGRWRWRARPNA